MLDAPKYDNSIRRRSVDTGGLALSLQDHNTGKGWGGWDDREPAQIPYAELFAALYSQTAQPATWSCPSPNPATHMRLVQALSDWSFDPHTLPPDELMTCTCLIFQTVLIVDGMMEECRVTHEQFRPFLQAVRSIYHQQNKYHNFHHALDVLQATHSFLCASGCLPPVTYLLENGGRPAKWKRPTRPGRVKDLLRNLDVFALCIAAIGHDVGHPGLSNAFMKNARTPLSQVYDDKSPLEQMHCTLLLRLMRNFNLGHLVDPASTAYEGFRNLLVQTVLATDMSVHFDWMGRFSRFSDKVARGHTMSEKEKEEGRLFICQAFIKCADISNPTRPHQISTLWSTALLSEWAFLTSLEKSLNLPSSVPQKDVDEDVKNRDDPEVQLKQAKGQLGFIQMFAGPLFEAVASFAPELSCFAQRSATNRELWRSRLETLTTAVELSAATRHQNAHRPHSAITPTSLNSPPTIITTDASSHSEDEVEDVVSRPSSSSSSTPPQSARTSWTGTTAPSSANSSASSLFGHYMLQSSSSSSSTLFEQRHGTYGLRLSPEQSQAGGMDALHAAYGASRRRRASRSSDNPSRRSSWHVVVATEGTEEAFRAMEAQLGEGCSCSSVSLRESCCLHSESTAPQLQPAPAGHAVKVVPS